MANNKKTTWDTVEREILSFIGEVDNIVKPDYDFNYTGTLPLDFDKFPLVQNIYEEGKGSNIVTAYDTDDLDNPTKWILYPTMVEGKLLNDAEIDSMLQINQHFGIYDSQHEMEEADKNIHEYFEELHGGYK